MFGTKSILTQIIKLHGKALCLGFVHIPDIGPIPFKTRRGSPVDRRASTAEAPPIRKIHPFSQIALTLEPVMQFICPSKKHENSLFLN